MFQGGKRIKCLPFPRGVGILSLVCTVKKGGRGMKLRRLARRVLLPALFWLLLWQGAVWYLLWGAPCWS